MGTNATGFAFGVEGGLDTYDQIKAYISIQPLVYGHFLRGMGIPEFLVKSGNEANLKRGGVDFFRTPLENLKSVRVPTLMVQNRNDPWTNLDWVQKYYDALSLDEAAHKKRCSGSTCRRSAPPRMTGLGPNPRMCFAGLIRTFEDHHEKNRNRIWRLVCRRNRNGTTWT